MQAWGGMLRVHALVMEALDDELEFEQRLPLSSYDVLTNLSAAPGGQRRMNELANHVLMSKSGLTRVVDVLEKQGLVERIRSGADGRGLYARLTPAGRTKFRAAHKVHLRGVRARFLDKLTEPQLQSLAEAWKSVHPELFPADS
jgi:DNA-binding MarR family transcriptional regulator